MRGVFLTSRICCEAINLKREQSSRHSWRLNQLRVGIWVLSERERHFGNFLSSPSPYPWPVDKLNSSVWVTGSAGVRGGGWGRQLSQISPLPVLVCWHFDTNVRTQSFPAVALWQDTISQGAPSSKRESRPVITGCFKFVALANGEMCLSRSPLLKETLDVDFLCGCNSLNPQRSHMSAEKDQWLAGF